LSIEDAVSRHDGEAREPARGFKELSRRDRGSLIAFLKSL